MFFNSWIIRVYVVMTGYWLIRRKPIGFEIYYCLLTNPDTYRD